MRTVDPTDRLELADLAVRYGLAYDAGDGAACAALFAPGGVFAVRGGLRLDGPQAIAAFVAQRHEQVPDIRHFPGPMAVDVESDGRRARGRSYVCALRLDDAANLRLVTIGEYTDDFVRLEGGWRIDQREYTPWLPKAASDAVLAP